MVKNTFETQYDVVMKTARVELWCHVNIYLQAGIYLWRRNWKQGVKKNLFCLNSVPARGPAKGQDHNLD